MITLNEIYTEACGRIDEDYDEYKERAIVFMNTIFAEILSYENNIRSFLGEELLMYPVRCSDLLEEFPYNQSFVTPFSLLLSSAILDEDDLNKSQYYRNKAIDLMNLGKKFIFRSAEEMEDNYVNDTTTDEESGDLSG